MLSIALKVGNGKSFVKYPIDKRCFLCDKTLVLVRLVTYREGIHKEQSSQLATLESQIFTIKGQIFDPLSQLPNLLSSKLFWSLLSSHLRFWVSFNLLSSRRLIFRLFKSPVTPYLFFLHVHGYTPLENIAYSLDVPVWVRRNSLIHTRFSSVSNTASLPPSFSQ